MTEIDTLDTCIRQMLELHFPRDTIVNILRFSGHSNPEQLVSDVEDEPIRRAIRNIA
jgi:hypothetical protein